MELLQILPKAIVLEIPCLPASFQQRLRLKMSEVQV